MAKVQPQYSIAFNEHPVHENLKQLKQQVADLPSELLEEAREQDAPASLPRLDPALEFVGALLASADTALVTQHMLDDLNEAVQQISSALTPFKDNDFEQLPTIQSALKRCSIGRYGWHPPLGSGRRVTRGRQQRFWARHRRQRRASSKSKRATCKGS